MMLFGMLLNGLFLVSGAPFFVVLGLGSALVLLFNYNVLPSTLAMVIFDAANDYVLLAMPFFILAGTLLLGGGGVKRGVDFFDALAGHVRGGLAVATIGFCTLFAALCGSTLATAAAAGTLMIPEMKRHGYSDDVAGPVVTASGGLGNLIAPSIFFVLFGAFSKTSVAKLFAAGFIPGLMVAAGLAIVAVIQCRRKHFPLKEHASWRVRGATFIKAIPMLLMPLFILGGIYGGIFTPTEAAAMSCFYAIFVGWVVYRDFTWKSFLESIRSTVTMCSVLYIMLAGIFLFNHLIKLTGVIANLTTMIAGAQLPPIVFVLAILALIIAMGFFIDPWISVMMVPILLPIFHALNLNLLWVGVLFAVCTVAGGCTPPFAPTLYVTSKVGNIPAEEIIKGIWPFLMSHFLVVILVTFFPQLALWLPGIIVPAR